MKIRLTENRLRRLDLAITMDDLLYEKFRRLDADLRRREMAFQKKREVIRVYESREDGVRIAKMILEYERTPEGLVLVVR